MTKISYLKKLQTRDSLPIRIICIILQFPRKDCSYPLEKVIMCLKVFSHLELQCIIDACFHKAVVCS